MAHQYAESARDCLIQQTYVPRDYPTDADKQYRYSTHAWKSSLESVCSAVGETAINCKAVVRDVSRCGGKLPVAAVCLPREGTSCREMSMTLVFVLVEDLYSIQQPQQSAFVGNNYKVGTVARH